LQANFKKFAATQGGIAQLGERLHGMQEVIGSIPFTSTNFFGIRSARLERVVEKRFRSEFFVRPLKSLSGKFQGSDPIV
jgi:hypothetical protein